MREAELEHLKKYYGDHITKAPIVSWDVEKAFQIFRRLIPKRDYIIKPVESWGKPPKPFSHKQISYEQISCILSLYDTAECDTEHLVDLIVEMDIEYMKQNSL